jgi:hypothetical protein
MRLVWAEPGVWQPYRGEPVIPALNLGAVVHTQAEIAEWSTGSLHTSLAGTSLGNVSRTVGSWSTSLVDANLTTLLGDAHHMKVQAVLGQADSSTRTARWNKVAAMADDLASVTSWDFSTAHTGRLWRGWIITNWCQALAITGYRSTGFDTFLQAVACGWTGPGSRGTMDWVTGGNWFASFADSRLAAASYLEDEAMWADAKAFFEFRLPQTVFHRTHDGDYVAPLRNGDWPGTQTDSISSGRSTSHWGGTWSVAQIDSTREAVYRGPTMPDYAQLTPFEDGVNAERTRDISHETMSIASWVQAARTIRACDQLSTHARDRLVEFAGYHAPRCLSWIDESTLLQPYGVEGSPAGVAGTSYAMGWYGIRRFLSLVGASVPSAVTTLLSRSTIQSNNLTGGNGIMADRYTNQIV